MSISITIVGENAHQVLEELRVLLQSTAAAAPAPTTTAPLPAQTIAEVEAVTRRTRKPSSAPKEVIEGEATVVEAPAPAPVPPPPPPPPPPPAPTATLADLRAEATRIMQTDGTDFDERQNLVMSTIKRIAGVGKFNEVPPEKIDELHAALKAII